MADSDLVMVKEIQESDHRMGQVMDLVLALVAVTVTVLVQRELHVNKVVRKIKSCSLKKTSHTERFFFNQSNFDYSVYLFVYVVDNINLLSNDILHKVRLNK